MNFLNLFITFVLYKYVEVANVIYIFDFGNIYSKKKVYLTIKFYINLIISNLKFNKMETLANIKRLRMIKNIKQSDLAAALNIQTSAYSKIETGDRELKLSELSKIAYLLGVRVIDLFTYPDVYEKKSVNNILTDPLPPYGKPTNEENPYKLLYELQKENTELKVQCERLKNVYAPTNGAKAG